MIQVRAGEAQGAFLFLQSDPVASVKLFATLTALRVFASRDEDFYLVSLVHSRTESADYQKRWEF